MSGSDGSVVIRPQRWALATIVGGFCALSAVAVGGALRAHDVAGGAWGVVVIGLLLLPAVDWCCQTLAIEAGGLTWEAFRAKVHIAFADIAAYGEREVWGYRSGGWRSLCVQARDGARIDVALTAYAKRDRALLREVLAQGAPLAQRLAPDKAPGRRGSRLLLVVALAMAGLAALVLYCLYPWTLLAQRLFTLSAALGLCAGLALGAATGRVLAPRRPATAVAVAALCFTLYVPGAAFFANGRFAPRHWHTARVEVLARKLSTGREGAVSYHLTLDVEGIAKRFAPTRKQWATLASRDRFPACLREGAFGSPIIVRLGKPC